MLGGDALLAGVAEGVCAGAVREHGVELAVLLRDGLVACVDALQRLLWRRLYLLWGRCLYLSGRRGNIWHGIVCLLWGRLHLLRGRLLRLRIHTSVVDGKRVVGPCLHGLLLRGVLCLLLLLHLRLLLLHSLLLHHLLLLHLHLLLLLHHLLLLQLLLLRRVLLLSHLLLLLLLLLPQRLLLLVLVVLLRGDRVPEHIDINTSVLWCGHSRLLLQQVLLLLEPLHVLQPLQLLLLLGQLQGGLELGVLVLVLRDLLPALVVLLYSALALLDGAAQVVVLGGGTAWWPLWAGVAGARIRSATPGGLCIVVVGWVGGGIVSAPAVVA